MENEVIKLIITQDEKERLESVNKRIDESKDKNIYPTEYYINAVSQIKNNLDKKALFLKKASKSPILFFTDTKDVFGSHRNLLFQCIEYRGKKEKEGTIHEFQAYIGTKLNEVLQAWKKENDIEDNLYISVRNPNQFPSSYAVYFNKKEIIQFNIFKKIYGMKSEILTEEKVLQFGQKEEMRLKQEKQIIEKKLNRLINVKEKPFENLYSPKDLFLVLFKRKEMLKRIDEMIDRKKEVLATIEKRIERNKEHLPHILETNKQLQHYFNLLEPFFKQFNYQFETNIHALY